MQQKLGALHDVRLPAASTAAGQPAVNCSSQLATDHILPLPGGNCNLPGLKTDGSAASPATQDTEATHTAAAAAYRLLSPECHPIIGDSKQTQKLRQQVQKVVAGPRNKAVLLVGDSGCPLVELAQLIHAGSQAPQNRNQPLVMVDCSNPWGCRTAQQLLGSGKAPTDAAGQDALLSAALAGGTLLLTNVHQASTMLRGMICDYISETAAGAANATRTILVAQERVPELDTAVTIAVSPLHKRSADVAPLAEHFALDAAKLRGYSRVQLTPAALRQLTSYEWPANEQDLHAQVFRAVLLHPALTQPANASKSCQNTPAGDCDGTPAPSSTRMACASPMNCFTGASPSSQCNVAVAAAAAAACDGACLPADRSCSSPATGGVLQDAVLVLDACHFWSATADQDRGRLNILEKWPWLRQVLLGNRVWPEGINGLMKAAYPLVLLALFLGPQDREHSAALTIFWAGWWPLVLLSYHFIGRAWCAICPFMLYGREAQQLVDKAAYPSNQDQLLRGSPVLAGADGMAVPSSNGTAAAVEGGAQDSAVLITGGEMPTEAGASSFWRGLWTLSKWPTDHVSQWGGWFIAAAFAAILVWEEVWDLPNTAYLSGWLLLLITGGAVACSLVWERRLWCRYLCPIGGMNGLFAKLSMTEIRARPQICSAAACPRYCHNGRLIADGACDAEPRPGAVQMISGCPLNSYPAKNVDNHDCVMCTACLRACPNSSAQLRLRPPAADLWTGHGRSWAEVTLMFVLMGALGLHGLPQLCCQVGLPVSLLEQQNTHLLLSMLVLAAPLPAFWLWDQLGRGATTWLLNKQAPAAPPTANSNSKGIPQPMRDNGNGRVGSSPQPLSASHATDSIYSMAAEPPPFLTTAYALLPLVWAGALAHYEPLLLTELGQVLLRLAVGFGAPESLQLLVPVLGPASGDVVGVTQGVTLTLGTVLSLVLTGQLAPGTHGVALVPQQLAVLLLAAELWHLLL